MPHFNLLRLTVGVLLTALALPFAACGGGGGGSTGESGRGLVLLSFSHSAVDSVPLNQLLEFRFSEAVDASTVTAASIQIRQGPDFGRTVPGLFVTQGSSVFFEPRLPSTCDLAGSGFQPSTDYRVQIVGFPEEFSIRNQFGEALGGTATYAFRTRDESDQDRFLDAAPGIAPFVSSSSPANGAEAVAVADGNQIVLDISENLDPCSISEDSVRFFMYQQGDPAAFAAANGGAGPASGFVTAGGDTSDQTPNDPFTWGTATDLPNVTTLAQPQRILADIDLVQDFTGTRIVITPLFGFDPDPANNKSRFPENALLVVQVSFEVSDFGGSPMTPFTLSFTTENQTAQNASYEMEVEGETPFIDNESTADINSARAPSRVQGYMLFAGDGDNGTDLLTPGLPETDASGCTLPRQPNDGIKDDFDPIADVLLDTGSTPNTCPNATDGSEAVVWEFNTFRIRNGVTVRLVGVNPAIILVQGDVNIEAGGRLLARGDNIGGSPRGAGGNGYNNIQATNANAANGGVGVAGGGDGGDGTRPQANPARGDDGQSGYGSADGYGVETGEGAGLGGVSTRHPSTSNPWPSGSSQGGGGGGHAEAGVTSTATLGAGVSLLGPVRGTGGDAYGENRMPTPEAGGGGGAAGYGDETSSSTTFTNGGGAGGGGGGFVDITSSGDMFIFGTIDAAGSRGGTGGNDTFYGAGGGGGGAGGGVRLLTPNDINVNNGTITTAGGIGGSATRGTGAGLTGPLNNGGDGGPGRIVLEDGDSVISGLQAAAMTPAEGSEGFFRGIFDPGRFQGGGLQPQAISDVFAVGPLNPQFLDPVQNTGVQEDFVVGVPITGAPGNGNTAIMIEARGYPIQPDGTADLSSPTAWFTVGHFKDTGIESLPQWSLAQPGDVSIPGDNAGTGIANLNGSEFIQLRITMYLPSSVGPFDPGAFIDRWSIRFTHDQ